MIKITSHAIIVTEEELTLIIDRAVKNGVAEVMKDIRPSLHRLSSEQKGRGAQKSLGHDSSLSWVRAERYCEMSGEPLSAVNDRIHNGIWASGKHYKRTGQRTLWVNISEAQEWVRKQPHVETVVRVRQTN